MIGQLLGGGQQQQAPQWSSDERDFTEDDFMDGDVTLTGNGHELIGEVTVGANQKFEFGHGNKSLHPMEQGRPYLMLKNDDGEQVHGSVRFLHVSAQEGRTAKIKDIGTRSLDESTPDQRKVFERASKPAQKGGKPPAVQDSYLRIKLNASNLSSLTTSNVNKSNSTFDIPVTVHERN
jgi:hypothetical protein